MRPFRTAVAVGGRAGGLAARAQGPIQAEAVAGQPFGVGRITLDVPPEMLPEPLGIEGIGLTEKNGRVFYPAIDNPAFGKLVKELLDSDTPLTSGGPVRDEVGGLLRGILDRPPRTTVYFLFRGDEPLQVTLQLRKNVELTIVPRAGDVQAGRPLRATLRRPIAGCCNCGGSSTPRLRGCCEPKPDYPPLVDKLPDGDACPAAESALARSEADAVGRRRRFARKSASTWGPSRCAWR